MQGFDKLSPNGVMKLLPELPLHARLYLKPTWFVPTPIGQPDGSVARMGNGLIWFQAYELSAFDGARRIARDRLHHCLALLQRLERRATHLSRRTHDDEHFDLHEELECMYHRGTVLISTHIFYT